MIQLHPNQSRIYDSLLISRIARFWALNAGRGFGKSLLAGSIAVGAAMELQRLPASVPDKFVYLIAPTFDQVTEYYYPLLMHQFGLIEHGVYGSERGGRLFFPNNTEIRMLSYESIERMRGKGAYFVVWDEISSCYKGMTPKQAWDSIIRPAIITRWSAMKARQFGAPSPGRALFLSTPEGYNDFYDFCMMHEKNPDWGYSHYTYRDSPLLDPDEIDRIKSETDPVRFATEYDALFKESGHQVFYMFDRERNVTRFEPLQAGETVHAAIDFNVGKQHTSFAVIRGGQVFWFDEMSGHPDTEQLAIAIKKRFEGHKILAFPDPSGKARKTSAKVGRTDFSILESVGIEVLAKSSAPGIVDSVNCVNRMLCNALGQVNMYFSPGCPILIKSMERTSWLDNRASTATIDKAGGWEHSSDGVRYFTSYMFPIDGAVAYYQSDRY